MKFLSFFLYLTYFSKPTPHFRHDIHSFWNNEQKIGIIDTQNNVQELFPNRTKPVRSYHHPFLLHYEKSPHIELSRYYESSHETSNITFPLEKKHFQIQWDDTTLNEFTHVHQNYLRLNVFGKISHLKSSGDVQEYSLSWTNQDSTSFLQSSYMLDNMTFCITDQNELLMYEFHPNVGFDLKYTYNIHHSDIVKKFMVKKIEELYYVTILFRNGHVRLLVIYKNKPYGFFQVFHWNRYSFQNEVVEDLLFCKDRYLYTLTSSHIHVHQYQSYQSYPRFVTKIRLPVRNVFSRMYLSSSTLFLNGKNRLHGFRLIGNQDSSITKDSS